MQKKSLKIILSSISCISLIVASYYSYHEDNSKLVIWLTFSFFTFVLGWPETVESVSLFGNSIKLREVKAAINELKYLAEINSKAILELFQAMNRWKVSDDERLSVYNNIENMLKKLGFNQNELEEIQCRWHFWVEGDYVRSIIFGNEINHPAIPKEKLPLWYKEREELKEKINDIQPDELRKVFKRLDAYTQTVEKLIDDFEYYKAHKKHRDINEWKCRSKWFY